MPPPFSSRWGKGKPPPQKREIHALGNRVLCPIKRRISPAQFFHSHHDKTTAIESILLLRILLADHVNQPSFELRWHCWVPAGFTSDTKSIQSSRSKEAPFLSLCSAARYSLNF
jgi:hypothetical protein